MQKFLHLRLEMKIENVHMNLLLLVLGIFSLQSVEFDSFSNPNLFLETGIEESIDDTIELDFDKQLPDAYSDGGGPGIISTHNSHIKNPIVAKSTLARAISKDLSKRSHLFILYCCLKLDC